MKLYRLEAVRGFTAFYVCFIHTFHGSYSFGVFDVLLKFGAEAVMVFFVLSGFVISWSSIKYEEEQRLTKLYFAKRFVRIYSVWLPAVLMLFAMKSFEEGHLVFEPITQVIGNILMLQDSAYEKPATICEPVYGDTPLWSLHYEWWFYMLFPLVIYLKKPATRVHAVGVIGVICAFSYCVIPNPFSRLLFYFLIWWIGAHAAMCMRLNGKISIKDLYWPLAYSVLASLPILALVCRYYLNNQTLTIYTHPVIEARHLLSTVALVLLAFAWRKIGWIGFQSSIGLFSYIAPISFSLYVIHYKSIVHATYFSFVGVPLLEWFLYLLVTLAFCYLSELVFYPFIKRKLETYTRRNVPT